MSKTVHQLESVYNHIAKEARKSCTVRKCTDTLRTQSLPIDCDTVTDLKKRIVGGPQMPKTVGADTKLRDKKLADKTEFVPNYLKMNGFGQIPKYLQQRHEQTRRAREEFDNSVEEQKRRYDDERQTILEHLKKRRDELSRQYQSLPLSTDSLARKAKRKRLEKSLTQLAADIDIYERLKPNVKSNNKDKQTSGVLRVC